MAESDEELSAAMAISSKAIGRAAFCAWADEEYHQVQMQQGTAVGKRFAQLSRDAGLNRNLQQAAGKIRKRSIDNCKAPLSL